MKGTGMHAWMDREGPLNSEEGLDPGGHPNRDRALIPEGHPNRPLVDMDPTPAYIAPYSVPCLTLY